MADGAHSLSLENNESAVLFHLSFGFSYMSLNLWQNSSKSREYKLSTTPKTFWPIQRADIDDGDHDASLIGDHDDDDHETDMGIVNMMPK